jgi:hypothetical protein
MVFLWIILRIFLYGYCLVAGPWRQTVAELDGWRSISLLSVQVVGYGLQWMWGIKIVKGAMKAVGLTKPASVKAEKQSQ